MRANKTANIRTATHFPNLFGIEKIEYPFYSLIRSQNLMHFKTIKNIIIFYYNKKARSYLIIELLLTLFLLPFQQINY